MAPLTSNEILLVVLVDVLFLFIVVGVRGERLGVGEGVLLGGDRRGGEAAAVHGRLGRAGPENLNQKYKDYL